MSDLVFPIAAKLLLTAGLLLLAALFIRQAVRIWTNASLVLAPFSFVANGAPSTESGEQFARMVRADLVQLAELYGVGERANPAAVPKSGARVTVRASPSLAGGLEIPTNLEPSFIESMEIKAYGIDLASLVKAGRRYMESPAEISGNVTHQDDLYTVFAEFRGTGPPQRWSVKHAKTLPEASRDLACRIFRFLAASSTRHAQETALFANADDEEFCLFSIALAAYDRYLSRQSVLSDADGAALLAQARRPLESLLSKDRVTFPYVHKLAAFVSFEQRKFARAERELAIYNAWLAASRRNDTAAVELLREAQTRKLQSTPAVSKVRPIRAGTSVGTLEGETAGMITLIARNAQGRRYVLSATPVFGDSVGRAIVQPSTRDGGDEGDIIGRVELVSATVIAAALDDDVAIDPAPLNLMPIKSVNARPPEGSAVLTYGYDGRCREGKVISTGSSLEIEGVTVDRAIITNDISSGGEIGGPVVTSNGELVGMIFASGGGTTVVAPLDAALDEFNLEPAK